MEISPLEAKKPLLVAHIIYWILKSNSFLAWLRTKRSTNLTTMETRQRKERERRARIYEPSFWSLSLNSFSRALSIMSAKLPSLSLEMETLGSVALDSMSRSESASAWASDREGSQSKHGRSRAGAKTKKRLSSEVQHLLNIASEAKRRSGKKKALRCWESVASIWRRENKRERERVCVWSGREVRKTRGGHTRK